MLIAADDLGLLPPLSPLTAKSAAPGVDVRGPGSWSQSSVIRRALSIFSLSILTSSPLHTQKDKNPRHVKLNGVILPVFSSFFFT